VRKYGFSSMDFVQGNGVLLDDFDGHRFRSCEVPNLFALCFCFFEGTSNRGGVDILLGFAKMEALCNNLTRWLATKLLALAVSGVV
jgi:hypothetical protein